MCVCLPKYIYVIHLDNGKSRRNGKQRSTKERRGSCISHCEYNVYVNFSKIAISPIIRGGNKCENYLEFNLVVYTSYSYL